MPYKIIFDDGPLMGGELHVPTSDNQPITGLSITFDVDHQRHVYYEPLMGRENTPDVSGDEPVEYHMECIQDDYED